MIKILFVHHVSAVGGASYCLLNLLKEIDRYKYEPIVLLANQGPLVQEIEKLGIEIRFMPQLCTVPYNVSFFCYSTILTYLRVYCSLKQMINILADVKPDILYLNNSMLYPYLKVACKKGIRTVLHIREHWPMDDHRIQFYWFQKNICQYSNHIIAINEYSAQMVSKAIKKTTIIYDWIDFVDRYKEYDLNALIGEDVSDKKIFLYTGGMQAIKGALEVFETFSRICGDECRLLALGAKKEFYFLGLNGLIKRILKVFGYKTRSIRISEALNRDKRIICIPSIYAIKDIIEKSYCVLSYFTIPHANLTLAESIILKVPVIATRTEESEEYTGRGQYALLFDFKNRKQFEYILSNIDQLRLPLIERLAEGSVLIAEKFDKKRNSDAFRYVLDHLK